MLNEEVRNIMTTNPVVAEPSNSIKDVTELMKKNTLQQIPVVKSGKLVGLITSYDLWNHIRQNSEGDNASIQDVMTSKHFRWST